LRSDASDLPRADDACSLGVEVEAHKSTKGKVKLANAVECSMDLAVQGEQQRHGVFGYGMW
jgi:hypothetical protein